MTDNFPNVPTLLDDQTDYSSSSNNRRHGFTNAPDIIKEPSSSTQQIVPVAVQRYDKYYYHISETFNMGADSTAIPEYKEDNFFLDNPTLPGYVNTDEKKRSRKITH